METICMKCQILFSGKNKKIIVNLLLADFAQRVLKVKMFAYNLFKHGPQNYCI